MKKLILASQSPYRKELLSRLGIDFDCIPSHYDENLLKKTISCPEELTRSLSVEKAKSVYQNHPDALIIGSDQVAHLEGERLGKTGSIEGSIQQLQKLQGKTHQLITSYALISQQETVIKTNITELSMKKLTLSQIKNYLSYDNPIDCAGSYKLELRGISLFERIQTTDHTAIIGLPLIELSQDLTRLGLTVPPNEVKE